MTGWRDGLGPWLPVREGDRLYGRGGADDGYAAFASLGAIEAVHAAGGAHARCIVLIEASEESGSPDLPAHIEALADRLGTPSLVVCLDSGCLDYERLWVTTSLRGLAGGKLKVEILGNGVHSGDASGVVPDTFRIVRHLLDRVEDAAIRRGAAGRPPRRHPRRSPPRGRRDRGRSGRREHEVPLGRRRPAGGRRPDRAAAGPHLAAGAHRDRRRRAARHRGRRERAAALDHAAALDAPTARPAIRTARRSCCARPSRPIRPTGRGCRSRRTRPAPVGTPRRSRRGCGPRSSGRRRPASARRPAPTARAGPSRSWACWANGSPRPSS